MKQAIKIDSWKARRMCKMKTKISRIGMAFLAVILSPALFAVNLQTLDVAALPGGQVELKLAFDQAVNAPNGYTIEQPARIALDLPGVKNKLGIKNRELGNGNVRSLNIVETPDLMRLIINMTSSSPYNTRVDGKYLYIVVGEGAQSSPRQAAAQAPAVVTPPKAVTQKGIRHIDFQRGEQGAGNVVIDLSDDSVTPDIEDQGGKIRLTFTKSSLPEALRVRLDVKDFATPVQFVNASERNGTVSITIEPTGFYDYLAYQTDNKLTISVKPVTQEEIEKRNVERFAYTGEKLSLNFQDIDVRSVLQLIADFTDLNLVASDTVQGNITLRLQSVPWDQALDLVLKTKSLDKRMIGNVLLIAPADEIAARERQEMQAQKQIAELAPLRRELIQVNYAKAAQIAALFQSVTSGTGQADERGSVTVDDRTNSIIAYQTQDKLDELRRVVAQLDIPVRQVMIEARIVEANVDYSKSLGVNWDGSVKRGSGNWTASGQAGQGVTDNPFVDLGVDSATAGIGIGFVSNHAILDLQLTAMEKTGNGEVVSQPKVVTSDKETAKILKGAEIPYQEASSSGSTSTSFKEAALSLEVTPQITPDNRIIMDVKVTKDEPDFANALNGVPPIKKNEVNANVLVSDGETIVIGGVFSNTQTRSQSKVPFLGDVPFVGRLFRRDTVQDSKSELLVFITPRIMNNQAISLNN